MQESNRMSTQKKREYFAILRERYRAAKGLSKSERSKIIDEGVKNTGLHRKSVIRALTQARNVNGGPPRLGRPKSYPKTVVELLKKLYRASASATFVLVDRELNHHRWKEGRKSTLFALNS